MSTSEGTPGPPKPDPPAPPKSDSPAASTPPAPRPGAVREPATTVPTPPGPAPPEQEQSVGELVVEISEQASVLVREEIELAKSEVSEKLNKLLAGSVAGLVAGVFLIAALFLLMHFAAILLGENVFDGRLWLGYLVEGVVFIAVAAGAGLYAYRSIKRGTPPTPEMAIEEAKEIREAFQAEPGA